MKILYVLSGTTIFGGATKAFKGLLKGVIANGDEVAVFCPDKNGIYLELKELNIPILVSPIRFCAWPEHKNLKDAVFFCLD